MRRMKKIIIVVASVVLVLATAGMTVFAGRLIAAVCAVTAVLIRDNPVVILAVICGAVVTVLCVGIAVLIKIIAGGIDDDDTTE